MEEVLSRLLHRGDSVAAQGLLTGFSYYFGAISSDVSD